MSVGIMRTMLLCDIRGWICVFGDWDLRSGDKCCDLCYCEILEVRVAQ
jgi:hypothetical protein